MIGRLRHALRPHSHDAADKVDAAMQASAEGMRALWVSLAVLGGTALLQAEINIHYAYPLIVHPRGRAAVALHVDNIEQASGTLRDKGFDILCEADLGG